MRFARLAWLSVVSLVAVSACSSDDELLPAPRAISLPTPGSVSVMNATTGDIELVVADPLALRIDRGIVSGSTRVPIPRALFAPERTVRLAKGDVIGAGKEIDVVGGAAPERKQAVLIGVPGGPMFFAIGTTSGAVTVRTAADGSRAIEAEDPKTLTLLPADDDRAACSAASVESPFGFVDGDASLIDGSGSGSRTITAVTRDADGCRLFGTGDERFAGATFRVCIPDDVYPFSEDDPLSLGGGASERGAAWRIVSASGDSLRLAETTFALELRQTIESLTLTAADDATCARVTECAVEVPAKLAWSFSDGAGAGRTAVTFGEPIADPTDARRSYVVLRASTRPMSSSTCIVRGADTPDISRGRAWLAVIERAKL